VNATIFLRTGQTPLEKVMTDNFRKNRLRYYLRKWQERVMKPKKFPPGQLQ
jgi:hypothetical protein